MNMSSLREQLKQLSTAATEQFHVDIRKKKSLIYDSQEAAKIDLSTYYNNAKVALEHLVNLERSLAKYQKRLFSESSVHYEPSIQELDVKSKTDQYIQDFLIRLSPFLQIPKIPLEALDWLVQRYQVHLYQPDDILRCALPYHDTPIFSKFVQLIDLDAHANRRWAWLRPIANNGVPLSRDELILVCSRNVDVLLFICRTVELHTKVFKRRAKFAKPMVALFAQVALGLVSRHGVDEASLGRVLNHLLQSIEDGLASPLADFQAAAYLIVHGVAQRCRLAKSVAARWTNLVLSRPPELRPESALMLASLLAEQFDFQADEETAERVRAIAEALPVDHRRRAAVRVAVRALLKEEEEEFPSPPCDQEGDEAMEVDREEEEATEEEEEGKEAKEERRRLKKERKAVADEALAEWLTSTAFAGSARTGSVVPELYCLGVLKNHLSGEAWKGERSAALAAVVPQLFLLLQHGSARVRSAVADCLVVVRRRVRAEDADPVLSKSRALRMLSRRKERRAAVEDRTFLQQAPFNDLVVQEVCSAAGADKFFLSPASTPPVMWRRRLQMLWRYLSPQALSAAISQWPELAGSVVRLLRESEPRTEAGDLVWSLWTPELLRALPEEARRAAMDRWLTVADENGPSGKSFAELEIPVSELHRLLVSLLPAKPGTSAREIILRKRGRTKSDACPEDVLRKNEARFLVLLNHMRQASWNPIPGDTLSSWSLVHPLIECLSLVINNSATSAPAVHDSVPEKKMRAEGRTQLIGRVGDEESEDSDDSADEAVVDYEDAPAAHALTLVVPALGALLSLLRALPDGAATSDVAVEPLLDSLRGGHGPEVRRTALLVVSEVARLRPALLLRGMLPLLTFMRRHVLPLDDAGTLAVIGRVLDSVIPAYIRAGSSSQSAEVATAKVLQILADSFHHVPPHRRLLLFSQLGRCVLRANAGRPACLWPLLLLLADRMTRTPAAGTRKRTRSRSDSGESGPTPETGRRKMDDEHAAFLCRLLAEFSVVQQMRACADLVRFSRAVVAAGLSAEEARKALESPQRRRRSRSRASVSGDEAASAADVEMGTFASLMMDSVPTKSLGDALLFAHELDGVLGSHLASPGFLSSFVNTPKVPGHSEEVGAAVEALLEEVLQMVLLAADRIEDGDVDPATLAAWRGLLSVAYQILDKIHAFLPVSQHLAAVLRLCSHSLPAVQRKSLEMLHGRLSSLPGAAGSGPHAMTVLRPLLLRAVAAVEESSLDAADSLVRQTALVCAKELARLLVAEHGPTFARLVSRVGARLFAREVDAEWLRAGRSAADEEACGYALLAQVLLGGPGLVVEEVQRLLPRLLQQLSLHRRGDLSALHRGASLALLDAVCRHASVVDRAALQLLVRGVAGLEAEWMEAAATPRIRNARRNLAEQADPKSLLQSVGETLRHVVHENLWHWTAPLMQLWERHMNRLSDDAFTRLAEDRISLVYKLCVNALSLRQRVTKLVALPAAFNVDVAEEAGLFAVLACFRRLSPARRDDLMEVMFDWARKSSARPMVQRQIAFFRLCDCVAGRLPDELVAACTHLELFEFASSVLTQLRSQEVEPDAELALQQDLLLRSLLSTLAAFFSSGSGLAVNAASQTLIPAVVSALEVMVGGSACYRERCANFLLPCLLAMTEASGADETLLQPLCHQVCVRMRSPDAAVRCQSLRAMMGIVEKVGSVFEGSLLPDCLPYLAECLEDDQPEVQDLSYEVCEKIKQMCGGELDF